MIHHFGGIIIHPSSVIGAHCVLRHGVTIGARDKSGPPTLGDNVVVGAYAQLLGSIHIGDGARIGAMAVVLHDVPTGATVVGNPARIITPRSRS
ncbi:serine O-acetyltransferase [Paenarthrobacter sp. NEAU-H11]|uniref:serine O-acetyltransferase n=1 Tax=Paenarthrobacter sp. NEAU-H11 TaxID=3423924 RepID=UPI003D359105